MPDMKNSERVWPEPEADVYREIGAAHVWNEQVRGSIQLLPDQIRALSAATGENFQTAEELVRSVQKMSSIRVHNVEVVLEPGLLSRLKTRCLVPNFSVWLRDEVLRWAHNEVGW